MILRPALSRRCQQGYVIPASWRPDMFTLTRVALAVGLTCLLFVGRPSSAAAGTCSSSTGCKDCDESTTTFKCTTVQSAASCTCEVFIFGGTPACGVDGDCVYLSGGGGGAG